MPKDEKLEGRTVGPALPGAGAFLLLEMMMVVTLILILATISAPIYQTAILRAREAVLRDHLFTLRPQIDRFTLDNQRAPASLEELVEKGYLGSIPRDPFTGSSETKKVQSPRSEDLLRVA
jgi:general secretion pathway protein G